MSLKAPTSRLLIGLAVTLLAVALFSAYALRQIDGLRTLQTLTIDNNRKDSLQLLRIQNNLNNLALSMRDMIEGTGPYPIEAWKSEFGRIEFDLADALLVERQLAPTSRSPEQQAYLATSLEEFWDTARKVFSLAAEGRQEEARSLVRTLLQPRHASITTTVARFLIMNNEAEERAVGEIQQIYASVERNIYYFLGAVVTAICITSFYMIHQNRRLFESVAQLSEQRQVLARQLISMQEDIFRSIARELHDEFGQVMTAVGAMLRRLEKRAAGDESLRPGFEEIRDAIQHTLDSVRSLSLRLHPNLLDDYGLENALEWYVKQFQEQTGLDIRYEKEGSGSPVDSEVAIHVYRILQEALNNVVRHAQSSVAWVRMRRRPDHLQLEIEDRGVGLPNGTQRKSGLGLVAMRERSELVHGSLEFLRPAEGGTLIRLEVPLAAQRVSS